MAEPIIVTGHIELDPANHDAAVEAFTKAMAATRAEDGCEGYTFSADLEQKGRFIVNEQWRDQAAIDGHMAGPALAELMGGMGTLGVTGVSLDQRIGGESKKLM